MPKIVLNDAKLRSLPLPEKGQADYWDTTLPERPNSFSALAKSS